MDGWMDGWIDGPPADFFCLPTARTSDTEPNPWVLASHRETEPGHNTSLSNIVIHVDTNNLRMKPYKITKDSLARAFELA